MGQILGAQALARSEPMAGRAPVVEDVANDRGSPFRSAVFAQAEMLRALGKRHKL